MSVVKSASCPAAAARQRHPPGMGHRPVFRTSCSAKCRAKVASSVLQFLRVGNPTELTEALTPLPMASSIANPPTAWASLTRTLRNAAAADKGAAAPAFRTFLSYRHYPVPSYNNGKARTGCWLTSAPTGRRFRDRRLNRWLAELFEGLPYAVAAAGLPVVRLSQHDLFHGHLFYAHEDCQLGILFHASEYPRHCATTFPVNLGFCQAESPIEYTTATMDRRNLLWYPSAPHPQLVSLDVGEGSALHEGLLMDGLRDTRTVLEADFGVEIADINYFAACIDRRPEHRVFICPR